MRSFDEWVNSMPRPIATRGKCSVPACSQRCEPGQGYCADCLREAREHLDRVARKLEDEG